MSNPTMTEYYAARACEYENVYAKPERAESIAALKTSLAELLRGRRVLEIACGTGYWTEVLASAAEHIVATDINDSVLQMAARRKMPAAKVSLALDDAYSLRNTQGKFDAAFCGFWWSHVSKERLGPFLDLLHSKLQPAALVVCADNLNVQGSSTPVSRTDAEGNSFQLRRLENGQAYEVLKNFPGEDEVREVLRTRGCNVRYQCLNYYWLVAYDTLRLKPA